MANLNFEATGRPHLHHLLQVRLPKLGLDCDTYGPYVWGDDEDDNNDEDDDDQDDVADELRDIVLGVLQASSETHSDDDDIWIDLIEQIGRANKLDSKRRRESKERQLKETKTKLEKELAKAKLEEQQQQQDGGDGGGNKKTSSQQKAHDERKRLLVEQYGYEEPAEDVAAAGEKEQTKHKKGATVSTSTSPKTTTNRDVAVVALLI